ncbi:hypothetical protein [Paenarthrobacter sp. DKR-5]|uniref:hypothetical protein n=1 Tax=Paenarthrobacter sp. DKR-5 TaxID=2835535 RepID=UPI0020292EFA|nr:hypothetical protein [Paenarthrobacter sp. DKR-5]
MRAHRIHARKVLVCFCVLAVPLSACGQGGSPPSSSRPPTAPGGNPACDLITPQIAATVDPAFKDTGQIQTGKPPGSPAYLCGYMSKSKGLSNISVALISPASSAQLAETRRTPDCSPVAGIGDFACFQWSGWFRGEGGGASANTILKAVRGTESLDLRYLVPPPTIPGSTTTGPLPDGNAAARALARAAVEAGWGNGSALSVPSAPPAGPQAATNNPVCNFLSADAVKQAFGAKTRAQVLPGEGSCRYTFGAPGTPGPDSLIFSIESHPGGASLVSGPVPPDGRRIEGVGDSAILVVRSEPGGPKSLRPPSAVPLTYLSLMVARGRNMAIFTAQILISPTGPTASQTSDQLIALVKGAAF